MSLVSIDALHQVLSDQSELPPNVQLVLIALAWRTPRGRDSTSPTSHADIAKLTHQSPRTVARSLTAGLALGALEIVWADEGRKSRYRVNRGAWHVPIDPAELQAALDRLTGVTQAILAGVQGQFDVGTPDSLTKNPSQYDRGHLLGEERKEELPAQLEPLVDRLKERGLL